MMNSTKIDLCIASDKSMMLIVRMTTTGVMSRAGLTLDEMDDMKMAVDEACNLMILQKPCYEKLEMHYEYSSEAVSVLIQGEGVLAEGDKTDHAIMLEVMECILESMVDEVTLIPREDGGTKGIFLKKNIPQERRRLRHDG